MTDLTPHMTPTERRRYTALQAVLERGDDARAEMARIRRAVAARLRRAAERQANGETNGENS